MQTARILSMPQPGKENGMNGKTFSRVLLIANGLSLSLLLTIGGILWRGGGWQGGVEAKFATLEQSISGLEHSVEQRFTTLERLLLYPISTNQEAIKDLKERLKALEDSSIEDAKIRNMEFNRLMARIEAVEKRR